MFIREFKAQIQSSFFKKNFIFLFIIIFLLLSFASFYFQLVSKQNMDQQLLDTERDALSTIVQSVEQQISSVKYQMILLSENSLVTVALNSDIHTELLQGQNARLQDYITHILSANAFIDSIYLYSDINRHVFTETGYTPIEQFEDTDWLRYLGTSQSTGYSRALNNRYPYVYTFISPMTISGQNALIVFNINLANFSVLSEINAQQQQQLFILSDEGVIFSHEQSAAVMPLDNYPKLAEFIAQEGDGDVKYSQNATEIYTAISSAQTGWQFVLRTSTSTYNQLLIELLFHTAILLLVSGVASFIIAFYFTCFTYRPIKLFRKLLTTSTASSRDEIEFISNRIVQILSQNQSLFHKVQEQSEILKETEVLALHALFNPHFLFNTLNLIHTMEVETLGFEHPAPKLTISLCKILRYSLDATPLVSLETDLYYTKQYIHILEQRYPGTLQTDLNIDEDVLPCKVPALLIQPIIENAVVHGYQTKENQPFCIKIQINASDECMRVVIADNGTGISQTALAEFQKIKESEYLLYSKKKTGLSYTILKLKALYDTAYTFSMENNSEGGVTVIITFPRQYDDLSETM